MPATGAACADMLAALAPVIISLATAAVVVAPLVAAGAVSAAPSPCVNSTGLGLALRRA